MPSDTSRGNCFRAIFLFFLGITALAELGYILCRPYYRYRYFIADEFFPVPIVIIVIGTMLSVILLRGYVPTNSLIYGFDKFTATIGFILAFTLYAGIYGFYRFASAKDILSNEMKQSMAVYLSTKKWYEGWDEFQTELQCCGTTGPMDWAPILRVRNQVPTSCCNYNNTVEEFTPCHVESIYINSTGCLYKILPFLQLHTFILGCLGICSAFAQCRVMWNAFRRNYVFPGLYTKTLAVK